MSALPLGSAPCFQGLGCGLDLLLGSGPSFHGRVSAWPWRFQAGLIPH